MPITIASIAIYIGYFQVEIHIYLLVSTMCFDDPTTLYAAGIINVTVYQILVLTNLKTSAYGIYRLFYVSLAAATRDTKYFHPACNLLKHDACYSLRRYRLHPLEERGDYFLLYVEVQVA